MGSLRPVAEITEVKARQKTGSETGRSYRVTIPDFVPTLLNKLITSHYYAANRLKRGDAEIIEHYMRLAMVPRVGLTLKEKKQLREMGVACELESMVHPIKRRVELTVTIKRRGRAPDPDSFSKSFLDAMVSAGYLVDDSQRWCEWVTPVILRGDARQTILILTDL